MCGIRVEYVRACVMRERRKKGQPHIRFLQQKGFSDQRRPASMRVISHRSLIRWVRIRNNDRHDSTAPTTHIRNTLHRARTHTPQIHLHVTTVLYYIIVILYYYTRGMDRIAFSRFPAVRDDAGNLQ